MVSKAGLFAVATIVAGAGAFALYSLTKKQQQVNVVANAILPDGTYTTVATYSMGQDVRVSTIVPSNTYPVSVQAVINGTPASVHPWYVSQTGYNYIIDFGTAASQVIGSYDVYTIVTFADGSTATSNHVSITII
jgi:hypothetical protein